ncbi:type IV pilus biogenesis protein EbsA [Synechococcus sp. PCC 6312]|uniref:type IV pilus biogenesis protein EbsA n=1 Tax=Synechococcus sp. (strain ATCC 27167 / PCC 6312) TaxID=195253 RepID=UPI00029F206A|nr:type IV pilus biogenesis protein EbsA [Synechococcus sp. PCC 6312]AFY59996.1 hypothetical protein Syn6312_0781 [Synechococcus sp. PCC 6312]
MAVNLDLLKPAPPKDVNIFTPYIPSGKRAFLPLGIALYQRGTLEGQRGIEGGDNIDFVASWNISNLPADLARCNVVFDGNPELTYEITMTTFELVDHLIDVLISYRRARVADFSKTFYRKLLRLE